MHFINRCTWTSSQYYIIISMMTSFMRMSQKLVFHQSKCIWPSRVYSLLPPCMYPRLHVFAFSMLLRCMLKFKRLACGFEDVTHYNNISFLILSLQVMPKILRRHRMWNNPFVILPYLGWSSFGHVEISTYHANLVDFNFLRHALKLGWLRVVAAFPILNVNSFSRELS